MAKERGLTAKQNIFVAEYLVDLNATQAARRAGYSSKTADKIGPALIGKSSIQAAIQEAMKIQEKRTSITADRVLLELSKIAFGDLRGVMEWTADGVRLKDSSDLTDEQAALISEMCETTTKDGGSLKVKTNDKLKALELIGRHLAMFDDKMNLSGQLELNISIADKINDARTRLAERTP